MEYQFESEEHLWAEVQNMLDSPGWLGYVIPSLLQVERADMAALVAAKRGDIPEDFLRGRIALANSLLVLLPAKLREFKERKAKQELLGPDGQPVGTGDPYHGDNPGDGQPGTN